MDGPVSLQFNATLLKGARTAAYPMDQSYKHPIEVTEIRFAFSGGPAGEEGPTKRAILHQLSFGLQFGARVGVLDDVAPLPAFCRRLGEWDGGAGNDTGEAGDPNRTKRRTASWKLSEPVFVPAGARIYALMQYDADIPNSNDALAAIQVWVTLVGTALPQNTPTPKVIRIPWVSAARTPPVAIGGLVLAGRLPDDALQNTHEQAVVVQRMLGSAHTQHFNDEVFDVDVRVYDTTGAYIVRDATPMMELFNGRSRTWDMGAVLQPKEFISVEYEADPATLALALANAADLDLEPDVLAESDEIQLIFGLVGYREVPGDELYPKEPMPVARPARPVAIGRPVAGGPIVRPRR
ncbi:MAG: hypothetical protein KA310_03470 [Pseudomonadales bacterium]|nr:hypothetical protein [Pseudomonadales bacterium]